MSSCLTVIHTFCPVYLVDELVLVFYTASWVLKQRHQGLLKLHVHLGGVPVRGENDAKRKSLFEGGNLQKRNFVWSRKITCEEAFQDLSKSCVSSGGRLNGSNKEKNGQATEKRASLVKHRETPLGCWGLGGRWCLWKSRGIILPSFAKGKSREKNEVTFSDQSGGAMYAFINFTKYKNSCSQLFYKIAVLELFEKTQKHNHDGVLC